MLFGDILQKHSGPNLHRLICIKIIFIVLIEIQIKGYYFTMFNKREYIVPYKYLSNNFNYSSFVLRGNSPWFTIFKMTALSFKMKTNAFKCKLLNNQTNSHVKQAKSLQILFAVVLMWSMDWRDISNQISASRKMHFSALILFITAVTPSSTKVSIIKHFHSISQLCLMCLLHKIPVKHFYIFILNIHFYSLLSLLKDVWCKFQFHHL